ncbi:hypothetical protein BGP77_08085 [Saccharospirillum sp. MSK14-1]|uniref:hypothetical protein n=1 Tax=Saccharospirillum sp. MSK14-1 TaxID=1897632 RepID=UPI000D3A42B1|nr:hypothetical protein [Saccharospirillum sp. MSK14-1]PTY37214.1 hypothetical protein BGP77_08085 [Saccharospirillum sp. MSK14-1]
MSTFYFDLYYAGDILDGYNEDDVRNAMAALFKTDADRIASYFAGRAEVIKLKVAEITVARYQAAMKAIGAELIVVPAGNEPPVVDAPASHEPVAVDTSSLSLAQAGAELTEQQPAAAVEIDVSLLSLADDAAPLQPSRKEDDPRPPDTRHLSLAGDAGRKTGDAD